jgi:dipeptidyl aminopeptidase/acylaminoacyl peptidase
MCGGKENLQASTREWVDKLKKAGAPAEFYIQPGARHAWPTKHWKTPAKETYDRLIEFMDKHMKPAK